MTRTGLDSIKSFLTFAEGFVHSAFPQVGPDGLIKGVTGLKKIKLAGDDVRSTYAAGGGRPLTGHEIVLVNLWGINPRVVQPPAPTVRNGPANKKPGRED